MKDKNDIVPNIVNTVKENPFKSFLAYEVFVSDDKKKEINKNLLSYGLIGSIVLAFVCCLFAPLLTKILAAPIIQNLMNSTSETEVNKFKLRLKFINIILWIICIVAWTFLIMCNLNQAVLY